MSETVIKGENLSKMYRIGAREGYKTLRETIVEAAKAPFKKLYKLINPAYEKEKKSEIIWALKDVSFEVKQGDIIGIIGKNGAGKTTLLKILSKITEPTKGRVEIRGRVGSLLEVGTGFHPELTGHENIYLYGAILGMDRWEITRKFDEIVEFAGIEKFIDTPVKRYSSGMFMRLAFAVAAHLETEILLVDEVLAVGDTEFQKKCLGKMGDISKEGRTVLFVSHNMGIIRRICNNGILLESGHILFQGDISTCIDRYLNNSQTNQKQKIINHISWCSPDIEILKIRVNDSEEDIIELKNDQQLLYISISGKLYTSKRLNIEVRFFDNTGLPLAFFSPAHINGDIKKYPVGEFELSSKIRLPPILKGEYYISIDITDPGFSYWVRIPNAVKIICSGVTIAFGGEMEYRSGVGWILLTNE